MYVESNQILFEFYQCHIKKIKLYIVIFVYVIIGFTTRILGNASIFVDQIFNFFQGLVAYKNAKYYKILIFITKENI